MKKFFLAAIAMLMLVPVAAASAGTPPGYGRPPSPQGDRPTLSVLPAEANEGDGQMLVTVELSEPTTKDVTFWLLAKGDTARRNHRQPDFVVSFKTHKIPAGETSTIVPIKVVDDHIFEETETFLMRPFFVRNARWDKQRATGTILDNDGEGLSMTFLHVNDHHSNLAVDDIDLEIGGNEVEFEFAGFSRMVAAMDAIEQTKGEQAAVARVHAGDAITGTLFYTLFGGQADAAMMNHACFDVFALGNHEFDGGDAALVDFLNWLNEGDCGTATLAANVVPAIGTPLAPVNQNDFIEPYEIRQYQGQSVGFIGIDIAQKTQVSSQPLDTTQFLDEVETAQRFVDELTEQGIDKIVLVTHQGYNNDLALASMVEGVDVIIGGDSHSLLGDFDQYGLNSQGDYPTITSDPAGNTVCVVQAWEFSKVVGELNVEWDQRGDIVSCEGTPHLMIGEGIPTAEVTAEDIAAAVAADPQLTVWATDPGADATLAGFAADVDVLAAEVIGQASEDICLARRPNDGRSSLCSAGDLPQGGEIQQLVTDAFLARAFRADIALQNSGGVRIDIAQGDVTIADVYTLLPFANTLFEIELTGAEVILALEQGVGNYLDAGGSTGAFPYGSGIRWDLDETQPAGARFSNVEVRPKGATEWSPIDETATYIVVANSFMAGGGDGFTALADAVADGRGVDTFLDYAQSFLDYIEQDAGSVISVPAEFSLQNFTPIP